LDAAEKKMIFVTRAARSKPGFPMSYWGVGLSGAVITWPAGCSASSLAHDFEADSLWLNRAHKPHLPFCYTQDKKASK